MYGKWTVRRPRPRPRFGYPRRCGVMTGSISRRKERKSSWRGSLAEVFEHFAALFGTVAARLGARGHVLVIRVLPAGRGALGAALLAAFQHVSGQGALPGAQRRTRLAALGAIGAQLCRLRMFLLA